jgi:dissimilatory sulfite reductase (desulfoviridin) alpha/beta subunit
MGEVDYKELKKGGFMRQVEKDNFSLRLRIVGGQIRAVQLDKVQKIAERFGSGYVHLTSRQSIEIPFIKLKNIDKVKEELAEVGLQAGACGPRVRTITACQGSAICPSGLINTTELAKEFDERYYAMDLPHKFKLGITGCKNNCLKAEENDIGIKGGTLPNWIEENCTYCNLCEAVCPEGIVKVESNKVIFEPDKCTYCGKCVKSCPSDAWQGRNGYIVSFGGMFGNKISIGRQIFPIVFSMEKVYKIVEATLDFFKNRGKKGERFAFTLDRIYSPNELSGWDLLKKEIEEKTNEYQS